MKHFLFLISFSIAIQTLGFCQNGKIIEKQPIQFSDSAITAVAQIIPPIRLFITKSDFYKITYMSDGLKVNGYLAVPKKEGKFPCVIVNRGGNREFGAWNETSVLRFFANLASWDYVVVGSQYRGNGGSEGKEEFGGSDVNDVLNLMPLLANVEKTDTSRIGMYGWSRGGMMTYLALTKTDKLKAAVVGSGLTDPKALIKKRPEMDSVFAELISGYTSNKDSVFKTRGAINWPEKICKKTPLLLMAGTADWRVTPEEQFTLAQKLIEVKQPVRFMAFEGGQHSLVEHMDEVNRNLRNFLDFYLRDRKPWPNLEPHGN